jgi:DNA-binding beta-propeller fold protein YncE
VNTIALPDVPSGPYTDHLAVDLKKHRLFSTPQAKHSVKVFDIDTNRETHEIGGFENPHSILYREDLNRLYVTDGGAGLLKIYDAGNYQELSPVKLLKDADSIGYDSQTKLLYVTNGGEGAKLDYSLLSIIDTTRGTHVGDIRIDAESLEAMALESASPRIYIDLTDKNEVAVVDRSSQKMIARWTVTRGRHNIAIALDEPHQRLFVGTRDTETHGTIVVFDTQSGKEVDALPLAGWVDYIAFDRGTQRIYATCGKGSDPSGTGSIYVYQRGPSEKYSLVSITPTAPRAKTGLLVPELSSLYVAVPNFEHTQAQILIFRTP